MKKKFILGFVVLFIIVICLVIWVVINDLFKLRKPIFLYNPPQIDTFANKNTKTICILSIDGGGIKGILPAHALAYLAAKTKLPISSSFDLIVGVSTGAIAAVVLTTPDAQGQPKFSTQDLLNFYNQTSKLLFKTSLYYRIITMEGLIGPKYSPYERQKIYDQALGMVTLHQLLSHVALPIYDWDHEQPQIFHSWYALGDPKVDFYIKDILAGSTSPITFFPPVTIQSVDHSQTHVIADAAIYADNPAMLALLEAQRLYPHQRYLLVSLGAGTTLPLVNTMVPKSESWGIAHWLTNIFNVITETQKSETNAMLQSMSEILNDRSSNKAKNFQYYRIDIALPREHSRIGDYSQKNLDVLNNYGEQMINLNKDKLDEIARILIENHPQKENSNSLASPPVNPNLKPN